MMVDARILKIISLRLIDMYDQFFGEAKESIWIFRIKEEANTKCYKLYRKELTTTITDEQTFQA